MLISLIKMSQQIQICILLSGFLYILISAKCVNDHTTLANINSILLKCHTNKKQDKSCESQLMINIHISPSFNVDILEKYLVLDEAYEPIKQTNVKIMSPYLIVINRAEPIIMYPLKYEKTISVNHNIECPANINITKCPSESNEYMNLKDNILFENKRKQRHAISKSELSFIHRKSKTFNENKKIDGDLLKEGVNENILSKMGLIRILESPQNDFEYSQSTTDFEYPTTTLLPQIKYSPVEEKLPSNEQDVVKNTEHILEKQNNNQLKENKKQKDNFKYDISFPKLGETNLNAKADRRNKKKLKANTKKEWVSDYYEPLNEPNAYGKPVDQFYDPKMYANQIHQLNNPKVHPKLIPMKYKKSKANREKDWMSDYYDHDNFHDPLLSRAEERWPPTKMNSISSATGRLNKDRLNENGLNFEKGMTSKYSLSKYGLSKNDLYTYNTPIFQPYSKGNRFDNFNINEHFDFDFKPTEEELFEGHQNTKQSGDFFSNRYSINNLKRRYSSMPTYQYTDTRKRRKRYALDYEISNLEENLYPQNNDLSPCNTCSGKNKKTNGKPSFMRSNDIIFENVQTRDNDAIPCDTCGGKNKKPGGKSLPSLNVENLQKIQESFNENACNCCDENIKNNYRKSGHHSCICLTNSESCNCDSSKATRETETSKTNLNYSIYNMSIPIPFLTTKVRIFRKRHKTWWRIAPSITLNSLSGIFANGNLSILFSTHVDILELNKSLYLQNHKLVVPKCEREEIQPGDNCDLKGLGNNLQSGFFFDCSEKDVTESEIKKTLQSKYKKEANKNIIEVKDIADLGYFPSSLNVLQKCPNNDQRLCLNVLDDKVPAFNVKIKMPFRENTIIVPNIYKVKISRIVTDATTKDALQISVDVINKGLEAKEFLIYVSNCPISHTLSTKTNNKKLLLPNIGETIIFLLPFTMGTKKNHKFQCDIIVKATDVASMTGPEQGDSKNSIVAKRSMEILNRARCFCVWRCQCHCIDKLETHVNFNVCKKMGYSSEKEAGLLLNCPPGNEEHDICLMDGENEEETYGCGIHCQIIRFTVGLLIVLLLLGFLKAIFGLCFQSINRFGFDTVQPGRTYECTSSARIFLVNIFFFIIFIFGSCCKCCKPRKEDLMVASTEWYCNPENNGQSDSHNDKKSNSKLRLPGGIDKVFNIPNHIINAFGPPDENGLFKDDIDDDEKSTEYILKILGESKQSLSNMLIQRQNDANLCMQNSEANSPNAKIVSVADEFVDILTNSQIVYRVMVSAEGVLIKIPQKYRYCVQGFFLRSQGYTYEFVNYHPFTQYFIVNAENELEQLACPIHIHTNAFSRIYKSKSDVFEAGDLSIAPPTGVPCINIAQCSLLESSLCKLTTQQEQDRDNEKQLGDLTET